MTTKPISLKMYLDFLAGKGKVGVELHLHTCVAQDNSYDVKPVEPIAIVFEPAPTRPDVKPTHGNMAGCVDAQAITNSKYVGFVFPLDFDLKKNRLRPSFPNVVPKQRIAMKAQDFINIVG